MNGYPHSMKIASQNKNSLRSAAVQSRKIFGIFFN
nr:MAG TPA: hypothetical protein [Caudoviricetes sp.]DAQ90130.1 MAG TPA: hypothetical protein [Caudoviricetes sp.]